MKKGFTLIELLAVIAVLAVIMVIATPKVIDVITGSKEKAYEAQITKIKEIAMDYAMVNSYDLTWQDDKATVTLQELVDSGLINKPIINPKTGEEFDYNWEVSYEKQGNSYITKFPNLFKLYGVTFNPFDSGTGTRTDDAVGLSYTVNASTINSDFDTAEIFSEITEVTDSYGNQFIKIPKFYIKKTKVGTNPDITWTYQISKSKYDADFYLSPCFMVNGVEKDYILVGKYLANLNVDKLESKTGTTPLASKNISEFYTYAHNNGALYQQMSIHVVDLIQTLFFVEFANLNSQAIMQGYANTANSAVILNGTTDSVATESGSPVSNSDGLHGMKYRGIENLYGNIFQFVDGFYFKGTQVYVASNITKTDYNSNLESDFSLVGYNISSSSGWIRELGYDSNYPYVNLTTIPTIFYYDDKEYSDPFAPTNEALNIAIYGGYYHFDDDCGISYWNLTSNLTDSASVVGGRLIKLAD